MRSTLLALALLASRATAQTTSLYDQGREALATHHPDQAAQLFSQAAAVPNSPTDTLLLLARALLDANRLPEADRTIRQFLAAQPASAPGQYLLAYLLFRQNRPRESLEAYTRAAARKPPTAEDLRSVSLDYVLLDDYPDARRWLTRSLSLDPHHFQSLYDLARIDMHDGNFHAALEHLHACLALDPGNSRALDNLGVTLEALNRPADALDAYTRAVAAQRTSSSPSEQPFLNQGALLTTLNRAPEAVPPLEASVRLTPACTRCHEELARALAATGLLLPAIDQLRQAVALDPENPRLHFQLGQICRRAGLLREAETELKRSSALYGTKSSTPNP